MAALGALTLALCVGPAAAAGDEDTSLWLYLSIPLVSALVGWGTNWLALKMTFWPLEFLGIPLVRWPDQPVGLFGWQGIIPAKAGTMAGIACDLMTEKLIDIREVFDRVDPARIAKELEPGMVHMLTDTIEAVAREQIPTIWEFLPATIKDEMILKALEESPQFVTELMQDIKDNLDDVFDLKKMVVSHMVEEKHVLNEIFLECGKKEFKFIEYSGFWLGGLFGVCQMAVWFFYPADWILPAAGFVVGYLTNLVALWAIFSPVEPVRLCGGRVSFQGLFLKRQKEVSEVFARKQAEQVLTSERMWNAILTGPKVDNFVFLLGKHTGRYCETLAGVLKPIVLMYIGVEQFAAMKSQIALRVMQELPNQIKYIHAYTDDALRIRETLEQEMKALPPRDFEGVLHPVFEQDELKLILVGAALGTMAGLFQLFIVFA